ncbi:DUF4236 domain-containing protein [Bradyrhizobium sp. 141]|nr:DUF4236 domain-containing protein [Bradyrhizobium sp. 141]
MAFRFRRSFKIIPGVRLNLSGSGASVSLGPRGLHYTIGPHGTRTTSACQARGFRGRPISHTHRSAHRRPLCRKRPIPQPVNQSALSSTVLRSMNSSPTRPSRLHRPWQPADPAGADTSYSSRYCRCSSRSVPSSSRLQLRPLLLLQPLS